MANLDVYLNGTKNYIKSLPKSKLYTYLLILVMVIGGSVIGLSFLQKENYSLLFSGLSVEDASMIVAKLKEQKVPYRLEAGGTAIYVPKERVYDVRLSLASQNALPGSGGVGLELFDKTSYGMTEFVQNINYRRAIQGELQRTINQMPEIKASRVHIALPEKSLFTEREKEATASVFLKLKPGRMLTKDQVLGIVHLVAGSVEGLKPENVVVVDSQGKMLYKGGERESPHFLSAQQFEMQKNVERKIEESLQSMLDKFLTSGKSIVRASVELNFRKVERVEEEYQPNKVAITNEKKTKEKSSSRTGSTGGVPGVKSNLQKKESEGNRESEKVQLSEREESEATYEVSKTVRRIVEPYGDIKRISVAVVVDGKYEVIKGKKGDEIKYIPRTEKEIEDIRRLVARAIGFNEERGDKIEVINMPFETESLAEEKAQQEKEEKREMIFSLSKYGFYALIAFAILFFVVRPMLTMLKSARREVEGALAIGRDGNMGILGNKGVGPDQFSLAEGKPKLLTDGATDKETLKAVIKEWLREST